MKQKLESISLMKSGINNIFNSRHYVPILKWKRAEQDALKALTNECRDRISPIIELVMPKPKSLFKDENKKIKKTQEELVQELIAAFRTKRFSEILDEIIKSWGTKPAYIDFSLLYTVALKVESIKKIIGEATERGIRLTPILNLSDSDEIKKAIQQTLNKYTNGICLRVVSSDLENINKLNSQLDIILQYFNTSQRNVDLLVDLKEIKENNSAHYYYRYFNFSQRIKDLTKWRNFIFACGAFPEDLSECTIDEPKLITRVEWVNWLNIKNGRTKRVPTFADYAVRNPIYNEILQFYHSTSSIKYTLENDWLILKGKAKRYEIYLANAAVLVKDKRFYGDTFSAGDKFVAEKAKHFKTYIRNPEVKGTGNTKMWLEAFINHHLTLTSYQLANLP